MYTSQPCRHTTLCKVSFVLTCLLCLTALWAHPLMQGQFLGTAQCNSWVCVSWLCGFYPIFKPLSFAILFMPPYPKLLRCVHAGDRNVHNWMDMFLPLLRNNWDETFFFFLLARMQHRAFLFLCIGIWSCATEDVHPCGKSWDTDYQQVVEEG